ncbi:MAG: YraN family protein [Oscillospiraceae bacterium]|nr:YraN family protein [Oscillospiraceae bacterium]
MARDLSGRWGESLAAAYLQKKRYSITAANYRSRFGEIDLIAENKQFLVFVEVKLRKNADFGQAMEFVDRRKQEKLKQTAAIYLSQNEENTKQPRFDVIEIYAPEGMETKHPVIKHWENAFE